MADASSQLPRVSVVIPTLGQPDALERAICSVLDQDPGDTPGALELILIDDGQSEATSFLLEQYADQCRVLICSNNKGPAQAIQLGLDAVKAPIVGVLMPQDVLLPGALHDLIKAFSHASAPSWVVLDGLTITTTGKRVNNEAIEAPDDLQTLLLHQTGDLPISGAFFQTSLVRDQAAIDIDLKQAFAYEYACRLMAQGINPKILSGSLIARRQKATTPTAQEVIDAGFEIINTAHQYTEYLPMRLRAAVWASLDERTRIYTMAESEIHRSHARGFLWRQLLRHPWWLADEHYRHGLIHGLPQTADQSPTRLAA